MTPDIESWLYLLKHNFVITGKLMADTYTKLSLLSAEDENSQGTLKRDVNLPVVANTVMKLDLCSIAGRESCDSTVLQMRRGDRDNLGINFHNSQ